MSQKPWFFYFRRRDEVFADLDLCEKSLTRLHKAHSKVLGAIQGQRLPVKSFAFYESATLFHYHLMMTLTKEIDELSLCVWESRFNDDTFRNQMNMARLVNTGRSYALLISPFKRAHFRDPDAVCYCVGKHQGAVMAQCPVARAQPAEFSLSADYFGRPFKADDRLVLNKRFVVGKDDTDG